jgi:hypothetical protein
MIRKITKKAFDRAHHMRKAKWPIPGIFFQAENGKYYENTNGGALGAKEVVTFRKKLRKARDQQQNLL